MLWTRPISSEYTQWFVWLRFNDWGGRCGYWYRNDRTEIYDTLEVFTSGLLPSCGIHLEG